MTYEFALSDGRVPRTRISRPVDTASYGAQLWSHLLTDQLDVSDDEFAACVKNGTRPDRGRSGAAAPGNVLPAQLAWQLIHTVKVSDSDAAAMTLEQALQVMHDFWSRSTE